MWSFGTELSAALAEAESKIKAGDKSGNKKKLARERVFNRWLHDGKADTKSFRDPNEEMPEGGKRKF